MKKLLIYSLFISIAFPVLTGIILLLFFPITNFNSIMNPDLDIILIILLVILFMTCVALILQMIPFYMKRKSHLFLLLILFLAFTGLASFFAFLWSIITFTDVKLQIYWVSSTTFMIIPAFFYLYLFIIETFYKGIRFKPNKIKFLLLSAILLILEIFSAFSVLFPVEELISTINLILLASSGLYVDLLLLQSGFTISKKIREPLPKKGMKLIGYAGSLYFCGFLFNIINGILLLINMDFKLFLWFSWICWTIGSIFLYLGFTIPRKKDFKDKDLS